MNENQTRPYAYYTKKAWFIYTLLAIVVAVALVLFVAQDNEERFFFGMMTIASAYVFRPGEKQLGRLIQKFTGISPPTDNK